MTESPAEPKSSYSEADTAVVNTAKRLWPPNSSKLSDLLWWNANRATWTLDQWKSYALTLEQHGFLLCEDLDRLNSQCLDLRNRLSRSTRPDAPPIGYQKLSDLLNGLPKKRGRRPGSKNKVVANEVLALKIAMQADINRAGRRKKVTNKEAFQQWLRNHSFDPNKWIHHRAVLNEMSRTPKNHNNSTR